MNASSRFWLNAVGDRFGRWTVESSFARGGMSELYRAREDGTGKVAVLKRTDARASMESQLHDRFKQETRLLQRLQHENIVKLLDAGVSEDGAPWMVMELLEGKTLLELLKECGRLPLADVLDILAEIADGVGAAHALGVIHRDIKPANVFVTWDGQVKVMDFGIAKYMDGDDTSAYAPSTQTGVVVGTWLYLSPEQFRALELDERSDIYSLGVMGYELVCGAHPCASADGKLPNRAALGQMIMDVKPAPLTERFAAFPRPIWEALALSLEKDPRSRYATMAEFASRLRAARRQHLLQNQLPDARFQSLEALRRPDEGVTARAQQRLGGTMVRELSPEEQKKLAGLDDVPPKPRQGPPSTLAVATPRMMDRAPTEVVPPSVAVPSAFDHAQAHGATAYSPVIETHIAPVPLGLFEPRLPPARTLVDRIDPRESGVGFGPMRGPNIAQASTYPSESMRYESLHQQGLAHSVIEARDVGRRRAAIALGAMMALGVAAIGVVIYVVKLGGSSERGAASASSVVLSDTASTGNAAPTAASPTSSTSAASAAPSVPASELSSAIDDPKKLPSAAASATSAGPPRAGTQRAPQPSVTPPKAGTAKPRDPKESPKAPTVGPWE